MTLGAIGAILRVRIKRELDRQKLYGDGKHVCDFTQEDCLVNSYGLQHLRAASFIFKETDFQGLQADSDFALPHMKASVDSLCADLRESVTKADEKLVFKMRLPMQSIPGVNLVVPIIDKEQRPFFVSIHPTIDGIICQFGALWGFAEQP